MIKIQLSQGKIALIDDSDFNLVKDHKWCATTVGKARSHTYALTRKSGKNTLMHRLIMSPENGLVVDHKDGNGLNNQRSNLRICSVKENLVNSKLNCKNTSGFRGVGFHRPTGKFRAYISINDKTIHLGLFDTAREAARARDAKSVELHGPFAVLNII